MKTDEELAERGSNHTNKEKLTKPEIEESDNYEMFHKGAFVSVLDNYRRTKTHIKISSFTHKNVACVVIDSNARYAVLKSLMNGKRIYLMQSSIKDIEEI